MIFFSMLILGALIGFVGAGGAGVVITLLTVGFGVPIHTALGVALASMLFTMLSGAISHFREGEVVVKTGAVLGAGGVRGLAQERAAVRGGAGNRDPPGLVAPDGVQSG